MMRLPVHVDIDGFGVANNCLTISGVPITDIVDRVGGTPLYAYDAHLIRRRVAQLRDVIPSQVHIHYAMKANPMPAVVRLLSGLVDGLDVASGGELDVALRCGANPLDISFAGPGKRDEELEAAISAGIVLNAESLNELRRASFISQRLGRPANVAVRVNPDFELKSSGMRMSGGPKPFGIDAEQVPAVLKELRDLNVRFHGFHIFSGSQNLNADSICEAQCKSLELGLELSRLLPEPPRMLNIGGGFGIPYFPGDRRLDIDAIGRNLDKLSAHAGKVLPGTTLILELGRYLVGEAGIYICQVVDKKVSRGHTYLVTDGGLNHHLAASGNFGQVLRKNYPVLVGNRVICKESAAVSVVGPLCTPLDLLAENVSLPESYVDDLVVIMQSGAYGYTASPTAFLSHPGPKELLVGEQTDDPDEID